MNNPTAVLDVESVRQHINDLLSRHFEVRRHQAVAISPDYERLWQTMSDSAMEGKRLRPYLTYLSYTICGGRDRQLAFRVGTALELLHLCMLAHDDIIDRDFIRHDRPNIAGGYRQHYATLGDPQEVDHFANSAALLAGDLLLSDAYQYIMGAGLPVGSYERVTALLQTAIFSVAGGELLDTEAPMLPINQVDSLAVAEYKTAYYSCAVPLAMGAVLAGVDEPTERQFAEAGKYLGIAYQLTDDLLGVFGDEQQTGKSNMGDLREAKRTYLLKKTYELADESQRQDIDKIFADHRHDNAQLQNIKQIMVESGARQATEALTGEYISRAKRVSRRLQGYNPSAVALDGFIDSLVGRSS